MNSEIARSKTAKVYRWRKARSCGRVANDNAVAFFAGQKKPVRLATRFKFALDLTMLRGIVYPLRQNGRIYLSGS